MVVCDRSLHIEWVLLIFKSSEKPSCLAGTGGAEFVFVSTYDVTLCCLLIYSHTTITNPMFLIINGAQSFATTTDGTFF